MNSQAWYKQFWPWFLIFFPLVTIIACVGLLTIALNDPRDMVVDDYYKKGKAINLELSKFNKAKALYLHGNLSITDERITFVFTKGDYSKVNALKIALYHRTLKAKDTSFQLTRNGRGEFTALLDSPIDLGTYSAFIEPFSGEWKLKTDIALPNDGLIKVDPQYK